jgi:guanine deaminase
MLISWKSTAVSGLLAVGFALSTQAYSAVRAFRASILDFVEDPRRAQESYRYFEDGLLVVEDGKVTGMGSYASLRKTLGKNVSIVDHRGKLIVPGFIDTHIHYPQTEMIASYGEQLLEWLQTYTFPTESKYRDAAYAQELSRFFVNELLRNGTTTALVFGTVHPESVDALFAEADQRNMRMIAGKVMMDRNAPDYLLDTAATGSAESEELIKRWHNRNRLLYAITPRFAPTSTPEQLQLAGELKSRYPDVYVHTHLSENRNEIEWVKSLFPERKDYLDVYDHYKLTGERSIFAHAVHVNDRELEVLAKTRSAIAFCPTSNLFLGSGLFPLHKAKDSRVKVGMGTDVGAGTSFSMLTTLNEAYKIMQLQGQKFSALEGFYQATLGSARSLELDGKIGNFEPGKEADFVVLNWAVSPLQKLRFKTSKSFEERLFSLMMLGDDRNVEATYILGRKAFQK